MSRPSAIVTGASRGIGRAIAIDLARTHNVIATYKGRRDAAESLKSQAGVEIFQCDISSAQSRVGLMEFARAKLSHLDLLINNAGIAPRERRDVIDATEDSFDELIATNLKGPHFLTREAARWMLEARSELPGCIVFITSVSAAAVSVNRAEYCMSKAGLSMSAAVWAQRLAAEGIRVFEIRPGVIRTDMIETVAKNYEERIAAGLVPQRRMGEPADVARAVRSIADGLLDYSTGQILNVDGGFQLRNL
ncbi:MAG: short-chain dehydrogenase/reductase [Bryobacterales bacterium]|nr:short-chain dehydrogenase/reductase [Bryobacterales bacterium]